MSTEPVADTAPIDETPPPFEYASSKQKEAIEAPPGAPLLLIGGFNSGKTTAAILRALALCQAFPGYKVAVLRKTFNDLKLTTRPSFEQWIKPEFVQASNEKEVVLKNGSSFVFHHLDRPDSATILKGLEINAAILDQAEQMQEQTFTILLGRLGRWKGAKVPGWVIQQRDGDWPWKNNAGQPIPPLDIILTANPSEDGDPELHWLWQRFSPESPNFHKKWASLGYRSMQMPTTDNKFAGQHNIDMLMQQDEDYRKRFVEGVWVKSKGHLFRVDESSLLDYDPDLMMQIQNTMNLGRVMDHGDSSPTCCLWYAVDGENNIFIWQEYYQSGVTDTGDYTIADHRRAITQLSRPLTFRQNLADPSIFARTRGVSGYVAKQKRWSVADEYSDRRIIQEDTAIIWKPADNNEELSRSRLKQYLRPDKYHRHPMTGELGGPHIYFITRSPDWPHGVFYAINETRAAKRIQVGETDGKPIYGDDRDPEVPDHALDCLRYLVNSRPLAASAIVPKSHTQQHAYAKPDGKVLMTIPPIKSTPKRFQMTPERGAWKSKGGGY
jgi:hypothetical protein